MSNYKLTVQYDGSRYKGWQRLGDSDNTIQGKLENILKEQFKQDIEVAGTSRTDAGVHALGQIANFKIPEELSVNEIKQIFNKYLPEDISIKEVGLVEERFHSRYNAKVKCYLYKIWNKDYTNPFMRKYSMHILKKLDIDEMKKAAVCFLGEHNFTAFSTGNSKKKSSIKKIDSIDIFEKDGMIQIRIKGESFLYNMVRRMVGTIIEVGLGNIEAENVVELIKGTERKATGCIAEAKGLYLEYVEY